MKDYASSCSYNELYEKVKCCSKDGDNFCKELMTVLQQRAELEHTYSKGLQKLAGKLMKVAKEMPNNSTYSAWCHVSDEMFSRADAHRSLGNAFQQEAILEIRQVLDEQGKRKRPLDGTIERAAKLVATNWSDQLKTKKKLMGITREHEGLFNYLENRKPICTEKVKQKMLNRLSKSAELQTQVDEQYFDINMVGHQMRLKWENTLKNCHQITLELEKERIEVLSNVLSRYNLHLASFAQALVHGQHQVEQVVKRVDMDQDIKTLVKENNIMSEDYVAEFLMLDYFEEDSKTFMVKDRRRESIKMKLHRLEDTMSKTRKECEGIEKLMKVYSANPSFSNQRNLEDTEQQLDEYSLKLDLLEGTLHKLSSSLSEMDGKPRPLHRFSDRIVKWKDKEFEHSMIRLTRPVKLRKTPFRSRQSLRASIIYKGPVHAVTQTPRLTRQVSAIATTHSGKKVCGVLPVKRQDPAAAGESSELRSVARCRAMYDFTPEEKDELTLKEGDVLEVYSKHDGGWWFGALNGLEGHFPSSYVEELPKFTHT
ncbi:nostrin isoform X1 [Synchiropus splendidus]|uniref:nostrin isoform X1 n=1 Tax=Synchiropus splendidus TaxID=270530 RepID=UPI00237EC9D0|nr:nostrin isoform X1 [Synchiropus splendidus]